MLTTIFYAFIFVSSIYVEGKDGNRYIPDGYCMNVLILGLRDRFCLVPVPDWGNIPARYPVPGTHP